MTVYDWKTSFAAGEIAPNLYARTDLDKYKVGAALARNFFVDFRGGLSNRGGTQFLEFLGGQAYTDPLGGQLAFANGRPRMIPFIVGEQDGYALEFGQDYIHIWQFGVPIFDLSGGITSISQANPAVVTQPGHGFSNGDPIRIYNAQGMLQINNTYIAANVTTNTYELIPTPGTAFQVLVNSSHFPAYAGGGVGARILRLFTNYNLADLALLKYSQSGDTLTLTHPNYPPSQLVLNNGTWTFSTITTGSKQDPPTSLVVTNPGTTSPDYCYCYVVTAVSADGKSESVPCAPVLNHYTILDETKGFIISLTWASALNPISVYRIYKCGPYDDRNSSGPGTIFGYIGSSQTTCFVDNNIAPDFSQVPPLFGDPFSGGQFEALSVTGGGSGYPAGPSWTGYIPLTITNPGGPGIDAAGFAVTNYAGVVTGVYLTNFGKNYLTVGATIVVVAGSGGATFSAQISGPPTYPGVSTYFNQRQLFAGSNTKPETVFLSETGDYLNFNTSPISEAADAIAEDISTSEVNRVTGLMVVAYGLLVLTTGGIYLMSGGSPGAPVTPASITNNAQASNGANDLPPLRINYNVLYMQFKGNIVREANFAWQRQSYVGADISTLSNHLFFNQTINEWCWAEEPFKLVWAVRDDGVLLSMAYVPDQEVRGWTHHDTNGLWKSICSIPEGNYNVVYMLALRYFPEYAGGGWFYTVERMDTRTFDYIEDCWFLDCAQASTLTTIADFPNASPGVITSNGTTGTITLTAQGPAAGVFVNAQAGDIFWALGGRAQITSIVSSSQVKATVIDPFPAMTDDPLGVAQPLVGNWSYGPLLTEIVGLDMYDGMTVGILADGEPQEAQVVSGGTLTLTTPASKVLIGLPFTSDGQTLPVEFEDRMGSMQGRRKTVVAATTRLYQTLGLTIGESFDALQPMTDYDLQVPFTPPAVPNSGDIRVPLGSDYNEFGQVAFEQTYPLPATVLGISLEVEPGDTQG